MKNNRFLIGISASIFFIYLIIWVPQVGGLFKGDLNLWESLFGKMRIDFGHLYCILLKVNPALLFIAFLITPVHILIRSHRWVVMIRPLGRLRLLDSYSIQMASYFTNSVLPLRVGELAKGVFLSQRLRVPISSALGTVVLERMLDMICLLLTIMIVGFLYSFSPQIKHATNILSALVIIGTVILVFLAFRGNVQQGMMGRLFSLIPAGLGVRFREIVRRFSFGLTALKSTDGFFWIAFESILLWIIYGFQVLLVMFAFGFPANYPAIGSSPILYSFILLIITAVGLAVPSAPGGVGTFHAACIFGLALFGVNTDAAAGFALVIHFITIIFYLSCGLLFLWREGWQFGQLQKLNINEINKVEA